MAIWLKLLGAVDDPMPNIWLTGRPDIRDEVGFSTRARVDVGEDLVYYAIPQRRLIGLAKVVSHPERNDSYARWPWRSRVGLYLGIADYERAPRLDEIEEPGGRQLSQSVTQKSHIQLRWGEWIRAKEALEAACDPALGDFRKDG
jgi:hypothetical protein